MNTMLKSWLANPGRDILTLTTVFLITVSTALTVAAEPATSLKEQVAQVAQSCQSGQGLTSEQLQSMIESAEALKTAVKQSDNPQKKLFLIRLKKSQNLCLYLLQSQQQN